MDDNLSTSLNGHKLNISTNLKKWIIIIVAIIFFIVIISFLLYRINSPQEIITDINMQETIIKENIDAKLLSQIDVSKLYYLVLEESDLYYLYENGGTTITPLPIKVSIMKYDVSSNNSSLVFSYTTISKHLEEIYSPRVSISKHNDRLVFTNKGLFSFDKNKNFKIFFPNSKTYNTTGEIDNFDLISPVFSPDGKMAAYYTIFITEGDNKPIAHIRRLNLEDGQDTLLIDSSNMEIKNSGFHGFAIFPVRWYEDEEGEKLLLEQRNYNQNSYALVTPGFWIYNFNTKDISPITFYYEEDKSISECERIDIYCEQSPFFKGKSNNEEYILFEQGDIYSTLNEFTLLALDLSILETSKNTQTAIIKLPDCIIDQNSEYVWSYDNNRIICSGLDIENSILNGDSNIINHLKKSNTISAIYRYNVINIKTGEISTLHEEVVNYKIPEEKKDELLDFYSKNKRNGLDTIISDLKAALSSQSKPVIGWISENTFIIIQTEYPSNSRYYDDPISQKMIITDLNENSGKLGEYSTEENIGDIIEKLKDLELDQENLDIVQRNLEKGSNYELKNRIKIKYLGTIK